MNTRAFPSRSGSTAGLVDYLRSNFIGSIKHMPVQFTPRLSSTESERAKGTFLLHPRTMFEKTHLASRSRSNTRLIFNVPLPIITEEF
jgi:hypothetical protein